MADGAPPVKNPRIFPAGDLKEVIPGDVSATVAPEGVATVTQLPSIAWNSSVRVEPPNVPEAVTIPVPPGQDLGLPAPVAETLSSNVTE